MSATTRASVTAAGPYNYLPNPGSPFDGRMLSVDGPGLATLAGQATDVEFSTPSASLEIGIFDGDTGKDGTGALNPSGGNWDIGTSETVYTLYADPAGDCFIRLGFSSAFWIVG